PESARCSADRGTKSGSIVSTLTRASAGTEVAASTTRASMARISRTRSASESALARRLLPRARSLTGTIHSMRTAQHSAKQIFGLRPPQHRCARFARLPFEPTDEHHRRAFRRLAHCKRSPGGDRICERHLRHLEHPALAIVLAAAVDERRNAGTAERDIEHSAPPRAPETVAHDHPQAHSESPHQMLAQCRRGRIRIAGQKQDPLPHGIAGALGRDVRAIDAGIRHDEAEPMPHDEHVRYGAHDLLGFPEYDFDEARVLARYLREPPRLVR